MDDHGPIPSTRRRGFWYWDRFLVPPGYVYHIRQCCQLYERHKAYFLSPDDAWKAYRYAEAMAKVEQQQCQPTIQ